MVKPMASLPDIDLTKVTKRFSDTHPVTVVDDISFTVARGRFTTIIGPSGCGKSTLLRMVAGLLDPSSGTIELVGNTPQYARQQRAYGMVFQKPTLYPWRDVRRNIALPLELGAGKVDEQRVDEALMTVGLSAFAHHRVDQLSGGMQQLVALGKALVADPPILLLDEPFGALDELTRERMDMELLRVLETSGKTILMITHSIREAVLVSDEIVVLTPRPGRVSEIISVDLPRPRTAALQETPEFAALETRVRKALRQGWIRGSIIHGFGRGKELGFPTMNLDLSAFPFSYGVYAVRMRVQGGEFGGVLHFGPQATFGGQKDWIEVYLFDYDDSSRESDAIELQVLDHLRPTVKFSSKEELIRQMEEDSARARELTGK